MKLYIYESAYRLEDFDRGDFKDYSYYIMNLANIINFFTNDDNIVVFPIEEDMFYDDEYELNRTYIKDRILYKDKYWIYNTLINNNSCPNFIWYEVNSVDEIVQALEIDQNFNCAIVPKGKNIKDWRYLLNFNEDLDTNSLSIREKISGDFLNNILPKLEAYYKEIFIY